MQPSYLALHRSGALARRAAEALRRLADCRLCPRACGADRTGGQTGYCGTGRLARVSAFDLHFGEEGPLVGRGGSGTVFFARCNLGCVFCQNWKISRGPEDGGEEAPEVTADQLAWIMLELQRMGAENINLVSPSHVAAQILEALPLAVEGGLRLPLVYNSGGYDDAQTLALLDGVVDIYMPDVKFHDPAAALRLCGAADYPRRAREAAAAMHAQVGDLVLDEQGRARRGLLVRHLVLPGGLAGTEAWMRFVAGLSPATYVNVMGQYRPCGRAGEHPDLARPATAAETLRARELALEAGLSRLDEPRGSLARLLARARDHKV